MIIVVIIIIIVITIVIIQEVNAVAIKDLSKEKLKSSWRTN